MFYSTMFVSNSSCYTPIGIKTYIKTKNKLKINKNKNVKNGGGGGE